MTIGCFRGLALLALIAAAIPGAGPAAAQAPGPLAHSDRVRLAEVRRLARSIGERLWPGWRQPPLAVLLVTDSAEFLVGHPRPSGDFSPLGYDKSLGQEVWTRPARFSPTLLATFPAVAGVPTIVVGTAERTGRSSTGWVLTLLHEHFHQEQYSRPGYYDGVARLGLARGDTTGRWMLEYPFPYDSLPVQQAMRGLGRALHAVLGLGPNDRARTLSGIARARDALRTALAPDDYRYLEFQLWQEGVARYFEYAVARAAAELGSPSAEFASLPDHEPYVRAAERIRRDLMRELMALEPGRDRRVAFYALGAGLALLLEETRPDWKLDYVRQPFVLAGLVP